MKNQLQIILLFSIGIVSNCIGNSLYSGTNIQVYTNNGLMSVNTPPDDWNSESTIADKTIKVGDEFKLFSNGKPVDSTFIGSTEYKIGSLNKYVIGYNLSWSTSNYTIYTTIDDVLHTNLATSIVTGSYIFPIGDIIKFKYLSTNSQDLQVVESAPCDVLTQLAPPSNITTKTPAEPYYYKDPISKNIFVYQIFSTQNHEWDNLSFVNNSVRGPIFSGSCKLVESSAQQFASTKAQLDQRYNKLVSQYDAKFLTPDFKLFYKMANDGCFNNLDNANINMLYLVFLNKTPLGMTEDCAFKFRTYCNTFSKIPNHVDSSFAQTMKDSCN